MRSNDKRANQLETAKKDQQDHQNLVVSSGRESRCRSMTTLPVRDEKLKVDNEKGRNRRSLSDRSKKEGRRRRGVQK